MENYIELKKMKKGNKQAAAILEYAINVFNEYKKAIKDGKTEDFEELQNRLYYSFELANDGTGQDEITGIYPTEYTQLYIDLYNYIKSLYNSEEIRCEQIDTLTGFYDIGEIIQNAYEQDDKIIDEINNNLKNIELDGKLYDVSFNKDNDTITLTITCSDKRKVTAILSHNYCGKHNYRTKLDITYNTTKPFISLNDGNQKLVIYTVSQDKEKYIDACDTINDIFPPQITSDDEKYQVIPFSLTETEWIYVHDRLKDSIIGKSELQLLNQKYKEFVNNKHVKII